MKQAKFSEAMNRLFNLIFEGYGSGHPANEIIVEWFSDPEHDRDTSNGIEFAYRYTEGGMSSLLRTLINWDFICLTEDGSAVDVEESNDTEIAEVIAPFVKADLAQRVKDSF